MAETYTLSREHYRQSLIAAYRNGWGSCVNGEAAPRAERYADTVLDALGTQPTPDPLAAAADLLTALSKHWHMYPYRYTSGPWHQRCEPCGITFDGTTQDEANARFVEHLLNSIAAQPQEERG